MTLESTINNLKHFVFFAIPLSIAMTYLGVLSFYSNYNIDISTYLGFEDLTIIYSKYTITSLVYLFLIYVFLCRIFKEQEYEGYWDKTIFKTIAKRRIILYLIITIIISYILIMYETSRAILAIITISLFLLSFGKFSIYKYLFSNNKSSNKSEIEKGFVAILFVLFMAVFVIPLIVGNTFQKINSRESVIIHLDNNKVIDAQKNSDIKFIGKTSSFVFLQDSIDGSTIVYPMNKITEIEYCKK